MVDAYPVVFEREREGSDDCVEPLNLNVEQGQEGTSSTTVPNDVGKRQHNVFLLRRQAFSVRKG
jgi:hypothetical protein